MAIAFASRNNDIPGAFAYLFIYDTLLFSLSDLAQ